VTTFIELCFDGRHDIAYDLLAQHSRLREGLSKELWAERRKDWLYQAGPKELLPVFLYESEPVKSKLWLPQMIKGKAATEKEVEAAWSVELYETPLNHALPEIPEASTVYEVSQRRWYWASYTLVQEKSEWRIQSMTDEVAKAQGLSLKELDAKINEVYDYSRDIMNAYNARAHAGTQKGDSLEHLLKNANSYGQHTTYYIDARIKKDPLDPEQYENAALLTRSYGNYERCLVYLSLLAERFSENRAFALWRLGEVQRLFSESLREEDDEKQAEQYEEHAEETLKEALSLEDSFEAHISLIEIYIQKSKRMDDAEAHLLQARELATEPEDKSHVERHLAEVAEARDQFHEALVHYQNAVDYSPDSAYAWQNLGDIQDKLEYFDEAESSYKRAIELEPEDDAYYTSLCNLYLNNGQAEKAIELLEDGLEVRYCKLKVNLPHRENFQIVKVWMSHGDQLQQPPENFHVIGQTNTAPYAAIAHTIKNFYGIQFHPEVTHTPKGREVIGRFVLNICECKANWTMVDGRLSISRRYSPGFL